MHSTQHLPLFMFSYHCSYHITSTAFMTSHPLYMTSHTIYLWHHSHSNYDKIPTMFVTLNSVYKTSHMMNDWQHNECIWHDTQCICVIKPTWLMTSKNYVRKKSQLLHVWQPRHFIWHHIHSFFYLWWILSYIEMKHPWFTCFPHPNPQFHLLLHPFPLGFPSAPSWALVSCIQPGLVICFTLDNIQVSMLFPWNIPPSPSPTESKRLFYKPVSFFLFCI